MYIYGERLIGTLMLTVNMVLTDSPGATPGGTAKRLAYSLFNVNNTSKSLIKKIKLLCFK